MAGKLSWEDKVDSMLRQTGDNLERLKDQLHGQSDQSAWIKPPLRDARQDAVGPPPVYAAGVSLPFAEGRCNIAERHPLTQQPVLRSVATMATEEQRKGALQFNPFLLNDLTKRLNQQEMEIVSLQLALAKMEEKNKEHEVHIQQLKAESSEVRSRLADQGVHITTESKFEQWKAQMTAEVQSLYSAVSSCHSTQQGHSDDREGVAQLTHELQKTKISTAGDIHWLNHELRALKTHLGELELQVASLRCSIGQLQNDAEECKSHRTKHQHSYSQHFSHIRRDLDSLERRAVRCEGELQLNSRPRRKAVQPVHESSSSGDDGERQEQGEGVGEGGSFTSEGSGKEGESTAYSMSAVSLSLVREDSATDLSLSGVSTPTLNCLLADR